MHTGSLPRDSKKDVEVIPTSLAYIQRIEAEYLKDEAEKKKKASLVDSLPIIDLDTTFAKASSPTPTLGPLVTPIIVPSGNPCSSDAALPLRPTIVAASRTLLT